MFNGGLIMTRIFCSLVLMTFSWSGLAQEFKANDSDLSARQAANCKKKVEMLVKTTARAMGLKHKFGVHLNRKDAGLDSSNRSLVEFSSGVFIVDDGYVSNSSSSAIVRFSGKTCEIIKLSVVTGG